MAKHSVKTFLVEDSAVIRASLLAALEDLAPVEVVGYAEAATDASLQIKALSDSGQCELAIIDIFLKSGTGLDVLRHIAKSNIPVRAVVLSNYATPNLRAECEQLGAVRVFDKSKDIDALVSYCCEIAAQ